MRMAATLASRVALLSYYIQSFEPIGWAEELLEAGAIDERRSLTWLHLAASLCDLLGRAEDAVRHGEAAAAFLEDPGGDPILNELVVTRLAWAHLFSGRPEMSVQLCRDLAPADPMATARTGIVWGLATMGHFDEAREHAAEALTAAEATGIPFSILYALDAYAKAYADAEPDRALAAKRRALAIARKSNNRLWIGVIARELAGLEATHGDPRAGLDLFDATIESFHRSVQPGNLAATLGQLGAFFARCGRERVAATLFGAISHYVSAHTLVAGLTETADHTREVLGPETFEHAFRDGAAMTLSDAVVLAQAELQRHSRGVQRLFGSEGGGDPRAVQGLCESDGSRRRSGSGEPLWRWTLRACASCWSACPT